MLEHSLELEYEKDLRELRRDFNSVCRADAASLRAWFVAHPYLKDNDHVRIADVSLRTIQRWKRAAGLPPLPRRPPRPTPRLKPALVAPPDWRSGSWLVEQYPCFSIRQIARAIGRSFTATRRMLKKRGVVFLTARDAVRSRHPCCRLAWLFQHYVVEELSLTRTAEVAGVGKATLTDWLLSSRLRVRSNCEQQLVNGAREKGVPLEERLRRPSRVRLKAPAVAVKN